MELSEQGTRMACSFLLPFVLCKQNVPGTSVSTVLPNAELFPCITLGTLPGQLGVPHLKAGEVARAPQTSPGRFQF